MQDDVFSGNREVGKGGLGSGIITASRDRSAYGSHTEAAQLKIFSNPSTCSPLKQFVETPVAHAKKYMITEIRSTCP
jgi:hypothetical protein